MLPALLLLASAPGLPTPFRLEQSPPEVGIPFACGQVFPVSQGHDTGSHRYHDTWAWDFRMPVGTPVVAALDGEVRMARGDSTEGGCDPGMAPHANYVVISHSNGVETQYLHFSAVLVKPGDKVKQGQLLGFSGNTGWSCGPHLHFKVARAVTSSWNNPSIPARLAGYGDPVRNTLIAAPVCPPATPTPVLAVQGATLSKPADATQAPLPTPPVVPPAENLAAGGLPAGVQAAPRPAPAEAPAGQPVSVNPRP